MYDYGLARVDLDSYAVRTITSENFDPIWGYRYQYSISDSGQMVAVAKVTGEVLIYDLYQPCGVISQEVRLLTAEESCKPADLTPSVRAFLELREGQNYILAEMVRPEFVGDFQVSVGRFDYQGRRVELTLVAQSRQSSDLDYLALGDSFSSGEGDVGRRANGSSYYLPGTADERLCHLSTRSYPFLLRNAWEVSHDKMRSVACSGAEMIPDYYGRSGNYLGQGNRLEEYNDIEAAQRKALDSFTPGHVQQIEFVRKYQPKLVTLTGGGNDVGFARVLEMCASPQLGDAIPGMNSDCSYADEDSGAHKALLHAIDMQISITKQFISRIKNTSLNTKVVVVGYPSFVNDTSSVCLPNAGVLSRNERRMINDMTTRLNDALRRAAHEMDVSYVDIEDSMTGGRLCEGGQYVTGVWAAMQGDAMDQERFHPNAQGHEKMATAIVNSGVHTTDLVPVQATYRMSEDFVKTYQKELVRRDIIMRRSGAPIQLEWGHLARNTEYRLDVHSTPTHLGTFRTNDDGSIDQEVSFEDVSPGYHMLILEGTGVTGEKTRLYQFIEVHASPDDADGDGIKNEDDECKFIPFMFDEQGENICEKGLSPEDTARAIAQKERAIRILRESNSDILESIPEHERGGEEESVVADNKSVDNDLGVTKRKVASGALIAIAVLVAIVGAGIIIISWRRAHARKNIG